MCVFVLLPVSANGRVFSRETSRYRWKNKPFFFSLLSFFFFYFLELMIGGNVCACLFRYSSSHGSSPTQDHRIGGYLCCHYMEMKHRNTNPLIFKLPFVLTNGTAFGSFIQTPDYKMAFSSSRWVMSPEKVLPELILRVAQQIYQSKWEEIFDTSPSFIWL